MEPTKLNLVALNNANFKTSKYADELCNKLMSRLGFKVRHEAARLSIARSLAVDEVPRALNTAHAESDGQVIRGVQLFGDDLAVWTGLLIEHAGRADLSLRELQDMVRLHWHRGAVLLTDEWKKAEGNFDKFLRKLAALAGVRTNDAEDKFSGLNS